MHRDQLDQDPAVENIDGKPYLRASTGHGRYGTLEIRGIGRSLCRSGTEPLRRIAAFRCQRFFRDIPRYDQTSLVRWVQRTVHPRRRLNSSSTQFATSTARRQRGLFILYLYQFLSYRIKFNTSETFCLLGLAERLKAVA